MFENVTLERYLLVPWPYSQDITKLPNYKKHLLIATQPSDVGDCFLVEESWFLGVTETMNGI